jgi:hypothetical protein
MKILFMEVLKMNKYSLPCDKLKSHYQIGQAGSIADYKDKLEKCFDCHYFITCEASQEFLQGIIRQQNNLMALNRINQNKGK